MKVEPVLASAAMMELMLLDLFCSLTVTLFKASLFVAAIVLLGAAFESGATELGASSVETDCNFWVLMIEIQLNVSFARSTSMEGSEKWLNP